MDQVATVRRIHADGRLVERARTEPQFGLGTERAGRLQFEQPRTATLPLAGVDRRHRRVGDALERGTPRMLVHRHTRLGPARRRARPGIPSSSGLGSSGASSSISGTLRITSGALASRRSNTRAGLLRRECRPTHAAAR